MFSISAICLFLLAPVALADSTPTDLRALSNRFFQWRAATQPSTGDDINRVERPENWAPDWSPGALQGRRTRYYQYRKQLDAYDISQWSKSDRVDYLLLHSALERVRWELDVLRLPHRNPDFYVHQTLGALYELLLIHTPIKERRIRQMILRLDSFPATIAAAKENLTEPVAPFTRIALANLRGAADDLQRVNAALKEQAPPELRSELDQTTGTAIAALNDYRSWLSERLSKMTAKFSIGREAYQYFLRNIALIPASPEALLDQGRLAWNRAVAFETFEAQRNRDLPPDKLFNSAADQIAQSAKDEQAIRDFLEQKGILSIPDWLKHYRNKLMPAHIAPLARMGVVDDLTSPHRLHQDAISYIPEPRPDLSYFRLACARDPRPIIVHEGVPGHYFQLARSWRNANPIRRHFIDSGPIEGIGFYVEEMLLQFGLFDDRPRTREIIYNFMRLRALRVEVDIRLALGSFTIEEAGAYLARTVPMDAATANEEAGFFAHNPGQAISYQIGKLQILKFLADAKTQRGKDFDLRAFHDYLMVNGNVPIALLRYEYLGLEDEIGDLLPSTKAHSP